MPGILAENRKLIIGYFSVIFGSLGLMCAFFATFSLSDCGDEVVEMQRTGSGMPVYLILRNCGATTPFTMLGWVGELPKKVDVDSEQVVFIATAEAKDVKLEISQSKITFLVSSAAKVEHLSTGHYGWSFYTRPMAAKP